MPTIKPKNLQNTLKTMAADNKITKREAASVPLAAIKDLAKCDDAEAVFATMAKNLSTFLEAFDDRAGARFADAGPYGSESKDRLGDVASFFEQAAQGLDQLEGGLFQAALGLSMVDDRITVKEMKGVKAVAKGLIDRADNKEEAAVNIKDFLTNFDAQLAQMQTFGRGPSRDELMSQAAQKGLQGLQSFLGNVIAEHLQVPSQVRIDPDGAFALGLKDVIDDGGWMNFSSLMFGPLVDSELGRFDSEGLVGPAKLKMDQAREKTAGAMMAYVDSLGGSADDVAEDLYRMVTGKFVPPSKQAEFETVLKDTSTRELEGILSSFAGSLGADNQDLAVMGTGVARKNYESAVAEGMVLVQAELAGRADALPADISTPALQKAVHAFAKADPDIQDILQNGGTISDDVVVMTWSQAKTALKNEFGGGTDLDVVLGNYAQAFNTPSSDLPAQFGFGMVNVSIPNEGTWPVTVVLENGANGFKPTRKADGMIPIAGSSSFDDAFR